jgi:hypothetical protein
VVAQHGRGAYEGQGLEASPLAEVIVFGLVALGFALFPAPIGATIGSLVPTIAGPTTAVLTWGLVAVWTYYAVTMSVRGRLLL